MDKTNSKGFTIIEVVLVLAIAGLIFLMVFVALPALQRSQRDTQRRNDMSRVDTSLVQYQTNHSSSSYNLPTNFQPAFCLTNTDFNQFNGQSEACNFVKEYMNSGTSGSTVNTFIDPDGSPYNIYFSENWANKNGDLVTSHGPGQLKKNGSSYTLGTEFDDHMIYVIVGGRCDGESVVKAQPRNFAILYRLEGAGTYCIDDQ